MDALNWKALSTDSAEIFPAFQQRGMDKRALENGYRGKELADDAKKEKASLCGETGFFRRKERRDALD